MADELWADCNGTTVQEHSLGKGHVVWGKTLAEVFKEQNLVPDFDCANASGDTGLVYTHRVDGKADIYFVSNQRHEFNAQECTFRVAGKIPELWHPDTGVTSSSAPVWSEHDGRMTVQLDFEPAGSIFVVFRSMKNQPNHIVSANATFAGQPDGEPLWKLHASTQNTPEVTAWINGRVELHTANGNILQAAATDVPAPQPIDGEWNLSFPPNWGAPASITLDRLISWTDSTNDGVRYFSGTAAYEKEIDVPAEYAAPHHELWLDLGQVKNIAEVSLNGQDLGVLWKPPFRVNITAAARPGINRLVVKK